MSTHFLKNIKSVDEGKQSFQKKPTSSTDFRKLYRVILKTPNLFKKILKKTPEEQTRKDHSLVKKFFQEMISHDMSLQELYKIMSRHNKKKDLYSERQYRRIRSSEVAKANTNLKVMLVGAEFGRAKAGGLAEVMDNLPPALRDKGVKVVLVTPKHPQIGEDSINIADSISYVIPKKIRLLMLHLESQNYRMRQSAYGKSRFHSRFEGIQIGKSYKHTSDHKLESSQLWTYNSDTFAGSDRVYAGGHADPYRYMEFNQAVALLTAALNQEHSAHSIDIIHGHDWHTGWIPAIQHVWNRALPEYHFPQIPFAFTVHNAALSDGLSTDTFKRKLTIN